MLVHLAMENTSHLSGSVVVLDVREAKIVLHFPSRSTQRDTRFM